MEERINDVENSNFEITVKNKEKIKMTKEVYITYGSKKKKTQQIRIITIPEEEEREKEAERLFEDTLAKNSRA